MQETYEGCFRYKVIMFFIWLWEYSKNTKRLNTKTNLSRMARSGVQKPHLQDCGAQTLLPTLRDPKIFGKCYNIRTINAIIFIHYSK